MSKQYQVVWKSRITLKRGLGQPISLKIAEAQCDYANDKYFPDITHYIQDAGKSW